MAAEVELKITGLAELRATLLSLPDKLRRRALRTALAAGARIVRDEARSRAPVLSTPSKTRKPGTVRDAITVRTSKLAKRAGDVGVFVNVRPAKGAGFSGGKIVRASQRGAKSVNDPYYWRWLEFGRTGRAASGAVGARRVVRRASDKSRVGGLFRHVRSRKARPAVGALPAIGFLQAGAARLGDALRKIEQVLGPMVQKLNNKGQEP